MLIDAHGNPVTEHRGGSVRGVSDAEIQRMCDFLYGAVRARCKDFEDAQFAARDLLGGANYFWEGTPMAVLFEKYVEEGCSHEDAVKRAGQSAGKLLKRVLIDDPNRTYVIGDAGLAAGYTWRGDGPRR